MVQSNIDPKKPFQYVDGQFVQTESESQKEVKQDVVESVEITETQEASTEEQTEKLVDDTVVEQKQQEATDKKTVKKSEKKKKIVKEKSEV